MTPVFTGRVGH